MKLANDRPSFITFNKNHRFNTPLHLVSANSEKTACNREFDLAAVTSYPSHIASRANSIDHGRLVACGRCDDRTNFATAIEVLRLVEDADAQAVEAQMKVADEEKENTNHQV